MITVLVGQRGTGKSSVLGRLKVYLEKKGATIGCIDLDMEIQIHEGREISDIFREDGEEAFRHLEKKYFEILLQNLNGQDAYIAVGGGFDVCGLPPVVRVIWLERVSEVYGRIFLDRPSLDSNLAPLDEFFQRAKKREEAFRRVVWEEYLIPEGLQEPSDIEEALLLGEPREVSGILTLLPHNFSSRPAWEYFIQRRRLWGFDYFEVRDDLLSETQIRWVLEDLPAEKILWARRSERAPQIFFEYSFGLVDHDVNFLWPQSLPRTGQQIVSVHRRQNGESLEALFSRLETYERQGYLLKLAIEITSFEELRACHCWAQKNLLQRSFLPRSAEGRWLWYRLWAAPFMRIKFFKEGRGSAADQPSLFQWLQRKNRGQFFAALLGTPILHSYTPQYQDSFFWNFQLSVLAIEVSESEYDEVFPFLESLGMVAAAVTSPLKIRAAKNADQLTDLAQELGAVNTLVRAVEGKWMGDNTDVEGLKVLFKKAHDLVPLSPGGLIAVWGGGGTLSLIKTLLPQAHLFSAQTGRPREEPMSSEICPQWVVWAGGRLRTLNVQAPPAHWRPSLVVDLNYREDSGGRELAREIGAKYLSGEVMFKVQGEYQRIFWRPFLEEFLRERKNESKKL